MTGVAEAYSAARSPSPGEVVVVAGATVVLFGGSDVVVVTSVVEVVMASAVVGAAAGSVVVLATVGKTSDEPSALHATGTQQLAKTTTTRGHDRRMRGGYDTPLRQRVTFR